MPLGRPLKPLELTPPEKQKLVLWARRPKSAQRLALRARIVLGCAEGKPNQEVARKLGVTNQTVTKWRERFRLQRLEGLADEPRPGAPRSISDAQVEEVITRTLESQPSNATHWSRLRQDGQELPVEKIEHVDETQDPQRRPGARIRFSADVHHQNALVTRTP
jgi:transposase-like protein